MSEPLVLGLESSCDETGVGIVRGRTLLANEVASSVDLHVRFGGVVPEVASRAHLSALIPTLERAAAKADVDLADLDAVAVTAGPGLMGALVVGLASAKALAALWLFMPMACIASGMCGPGRASSGLLRCWPMAPVPSFFSATSPASSRPASQPD